MGNYYEGKLMIRLKNNLNKEVESFLMWLSDGMEKIDLSDFPLFREHVYFKKNHYEYPNFEYGIIVSEKEDEWPIPYYNIKEYDIVQEDIIGKYLKIDICMKGYDAHMESFLDLIRPYVDETAPNYVGEIHDEDGRYNKRFYLDEKALLGEIKKREYLCAGCENNKPLTLCDYYTMCKRAYNIGKGECNDLCNE